MNLSLTTLTPVHVGTGRDLQGSTEYLCFNDTKEAAVLDDEKVLNIIGEEQLSQWIACIDRGEPLMPLLRQRQPKLTSLDVSKRLLPMKTGRINERKALREQLHSANGSALLPGSSLKGSLRTAIWASAIRNQPNLVAENMNLGVSSFDRRTGKEKFRFEDGPLAKKLFGKDPNHDIFRLLQVGDVHLHGTACYLTEVVNLNNRGEWMADADIAVQIEAIPTGSIAQFQLRYLAELASAAQRDRIFNAQAQMLEPTKIFKLVNNHTRLLIESEIKYWRGEGGLPASIGSYVEDMEEILAVINACTESQCVLRLGWGTGYRNMTGDWQILMRDDDYYDLVGQVRTTHPDDMTFPKTTRFIAGGTPLGFVKLAVLN